jgi:hypothetical protein
MTMEMTPHPGSRLGASASAAAQAEPDHAAVAQHQADLASVGPDMTSVPVQSVAAEEGVYRTNVLAPNGFRQLLPQDPNRQSAVILAIDADIILCDNKDLASGPDNQTALPIAFPTGFYLSKGIPLPTRNRGLVWAVNTSNATNRVSVLTELNANANPLSDS